MQETHRLTVLESFKKPRATTNPYVAMLFRDLQVQCNVLPFTWQTALAGRYDVFHVHWPEILLQSDRPTRRFARRAAFGALLAKLRFGKIPVVRTVHNLKPHEESAPVDRWLLGRLDRLTTQWISLNNQTPREPGQEVTTILHGHYRDWFPPARGVAIDSKRLLFFGLIRPYKGVVGLITAFSELPDPDLTLVIAGRPTSEDLATAIEELAAKDSRVELKLGYVDDQELADEITHARLVVLPYENMHNSGALLNALSLNRPVLAPKTPTTEDMVEEVGRDWVHIYDGPISPVVISKALASIGEVQSEAPDLSLRDWDEAASDHLAVFHRAIEA